MSKWGIVPHDGVRLAALDPTGLVRPGVCCISKVIGISNVSIGARANGFSFLRRIVTYLHSESIRIRLVIGFIKDTTDLNKNISASHKRSL